MDISRNQPFFNVFPGTQSWEEARTKCVLTASEYANAVNCVDSYISMRKFYQMKLGEVTMVHNDFQIAMMDNGRVQEEYACDYVNEFPGLKLLRPAFFVDLDDTRLGASPDGLILSKHGQYVLEIKAPTEPVTEVKQIKMRYFIQIQGQLSATGLKRAVLLYYSRPMIPTAFVIQFSPVIWKQIKEKLVQFMTMLENRSMDPSGKYQKTFKDLDISKYVSFVELKDL